MYLHGQEITAEFPGPLISFAYEGVFPVESTIEQIASDSDLDGKFPQAKLILTRRAKLILTR